MASENKFLGKNGLLYLIQTIKNKFVLKEDGKQLSTNDYTTNEKSKLNAIEAKAQVNKIEKIKRNGVEVSPSSTDKSVDIKVPIAVSELNNDSKFQTESDVNSKINAKIGSAVRYKGSVNDWTDLPLSSAEGDMYNIKNKSTHNNAGDNVIWNGTEWDPQAGLIDLSEYIKSSDLSEITNSEIDTIFSSAEIS